MEVGRPLHMSGAALDGKRVQQVRMPLPPQVAAGAALLASLSERGALRAMGEEFRVARRAGGFVGLDAVVFLLAYFSSGWSLGGLRGFAEAHRPFAQALGALAGRTRLMGQASLSRLLEAVPVSAARALGRRLLRDHVGALDVLRSPAVQTTDARGDAWHVFDFDPNREVYRRRDLARAEDRPAGERRTVGLAAPGHRGRKRGEVVLTQGLLSHQGSGLWLDAGVVSGNGEPREMLGGALVAVGECCDALGHPRERVLLRADGEFRGVPSFVAAKAVGVAFLTRLSRYDMLDDPAVRARLRDARWERVDDAGAGPVRIAADLGPVVLEAGETTFDEEGNRFAPVEVRVVVSAYPCRDDGRDDRRRGHRIGDSIFEVFGAVGLPAEGWSAGDVVCAYYGRCGQENRFAQADRELGIDRNFSFSPGGHLLAVVCALATWNWRIVQAVKANPLPVPSGPGARVAQVADAPDALTPQEEREIATPAEVPPDALSEFDEAMADRTIQQALIARALPWDATERVVTDDGGDTWEFCTAVVNRGVPSLAFARREADGRRRYRTVTVPLDALLCVQNAMKAVRGTHTRSTIRSLATRPPVLTPARSFRLAGPPVFRAETGDGYLAIGWPLFMPARARDHTGARLPPRSSSSGHRPEPMCRSPPPADSHDRRGATAAPLELGLST
ncbi:MAG: hypothetical protein ACOZNI_06510 [Myxococcota bacterium]